MHLASPAPAISGQVLVVDDQPRNLQQVKSVLSQRGFDVITAASGEEAHDRLATHVPDLILLDVVLPQCDGFEVCRQIKSQPATQDVPVIFLSAITDHASVMQAFETGGVDYITKPFNKAELLARVQTHVHLVQTQRRHEMQLQEHNRTLAMIAEEWHRPLQHIALLTRKIADHHHPGETSLLHEARSQVEGMLISVEQFLEQNLHPPAASAPHGNDEISASLAALAGRWYLTAKRKCVEMRIAASPALPVIAASPFAVRQIVDAVLANAVHHSPQDGTISVRITRAGGGIRLEVEDDGPGFPEPYLSEPFQPWLREGSHGPGGFGLGLAAARRTAGRIGARLVIGNLAQGGALVTVTFPVSRQVSAG